MLSVGLTGGIGAGKSAVSSRLVELGCALVDADRVAREVVAPGTPGLAGLVEAFGPEVLLPDGSLDRPGLGRRVFQDEQARRLLNAVVHPLVKARSQELVGAARVSGAAVLVHDVPLLVENGLAPGYHLVAVVAAPVTLRVRRLVARGLPEDQARARIAAQASDAQREVVADVWLVNEASREELAERVTELFERRLQPYAEHLQRGEAAPRPPVALSDPDPAWPAAAARLTARLHFLCPAAVRIDHIGSTAVPGLAAKDVVDLQVEVTSDAEVEALGAVLNPGGFPRREAVVTDPVRPELDPDPRQYRKRLHRSSDPARMCNVHVRRAGTTGALAAVAFRDLLRRDAEVRQAYEQGKRQLAAQHPLDVDAYAEGKTVMIMPWLRQALGRA